MSSPKKKLPTGPIRIDHPFSKDLEPSGLPNINKEVSDSETKPDSLILESRKLDSSASEPDFTEFEQRNYLVPEVREANQAQQRNSSKNLSQSIPEGINLDSSLLESSKLESNVSDATIQEEGEGDIIHNLNIDISPKKLVSANEKLNSEEQEIAEDTIKKVKSGERKDSTEVNKKIEFEKLESRKPDSTTKEIEHKKVAMRLSTEAVACLHSLRVTTGIPYEILVDVMIRSWDDLPVKLQKQYLSEAKQVRIQRLIAGQDKAMQTVRSRLTE